MQCLSVDDTENHRKRRAVDESATTVKVSRQNDAGDDDDVKTDVIDDVKRDVIDDVSSSLLHKNGNGDRPVDRNRKQSPLRCRQCDFTADQRAVLCRHVRHSHSRLHQSPTSSPDVNDDDDDDEVDVETEDIGPTATPGDEKQHHRGDLFCADCRIQFTSPSTYRAHHDFYCKRRAAVRRDDDDAATDEDTAPVRRRRRTSASRLEQSSDTRGTEGLRQPTALFPPAVGLMEMLSAGVAPLPPPPPGAFFLAPFLAAAAAAAAAGVTTNGLGTGTSPPAGARTQQPGPSVDRRSSTSASDDEPLDLTTCRDVKPNKHDNSASSPASFTPRQFAPAAADALDPTSLFLPPSARLPLNAQLPLPVVRPAMSSPPSISHCAECNIVFYKHANYLAHKAHYCAGRHAVPSAGTQDQVVAVVPGPKSAALSKSDDVGRAGTVVVDCDGRRRSPDPHELVATLDDCGTTLQFYCIPCKIKFSSLDTLRAHKQFYCPARFDAATPAGGGGELATTPSRHRQTSRLYSGSGSVAEDGERQTAELQGAGSCTACGTRLTSPRSGHRCTATTAAGGAPSLYQCPHCDYAAQSDSRLVEHVRAHAPSRAFRCALCGYRGNTVRGMRMHGKMHNDEAAAAAAGRGGSSAVQLPTFTDDCVIEYEEPPAIPARRQPTAATSGGTTSARAGVDTELLRQKNEPYKRRRSRKAYEKAEYAPAPPAASTTPVICAECSAPLLDTTHAAAHASAHATERLLAWEALYKTATASSTVPTPADLNVDQQHHSRPSPGSDETTSKSASASLIPSVKVEQTDVDEPSATTANVVSDDDRKCNGTDGTDHQKPQLDVHDERTMSPTDNVDAAADDDQAVVSTARLSSPPSARPGRPAAAAAALPHSTPARRSTSTSLDVASRYCEQCDITFMYASTFIAHKKYYCSSHAAERTDAARATAAATAAAGVAAV